MSISSNRKARENQEKQLALSSMNVVLGQQMKTAQRALTDATQYLARLIGRLVIALIALVIVVGAGFAWLIFVRPEAPAVTDRAARLDTLEFRHVVVVPDPIPSPSAQLTWSSDTTCWYANMAFAQSQLYRYELEPELGHDTIGPIEKTADVPWQFKDVDNQPLRPRLSSWKETDPVLVFVYGGHDRLRTSDTTKAFDSNFDLASQRAKQVGTWLREQPEAKKRRSVSIITIAGSRPPSQCDGLPQQKATEEKDNPLADWVRRRPVLVVVRLNQGTNE